MDFKPQVGWRCNDSYLHGCTDLDCLNETGVIEHVGSDYFILRVEGKPYLVPEASYWCLKDSDFN